MEIFGAVCLFILLVGFLVWCLYSSYQDLKSIKRFRINLIEELREISNSIKRK